MHLNNRNIFLGLSKVSTFANHLGKMLPAWTLEYFITKNKKYDKYWNPVLYLVISDGGDNCL